MIKMLIFDFKKSEKEFLKTYDTSDFDIKYSRGSLNNNTKLTLQECDETSVISIFITSKITKEVLDKFKNLRVILARSICYDHIDITECQKRNIAVINVTDYARNAISQYVIGLIFNMTRNICIGSSDVKKGLFNFEKYESENIDKLSLGVIGTGSVGSAVCELAHRLGMKIYANDIVINKTVSEYTEYLSLNNLLRKSDIVTLHIPYNKEFYHLISDKEFSMMKDGSYLINTCHQELIDHLALYRAIKEKKLKGVALDMIIKTDKDIFLDEKNTPDYDKITKILITEKLLKQDNVLITPRISYDTKECLIKILISNFNSLKDYFAGRKTNRVV